MISTMRWLASAVLLLEVASGHAFAPPVPPAASVPRAITLEDIGKIKSPGRPHWSPDGRQVAYTIEGQIYVVAAGGGTARAVTSAHSSASDPRWSRDGRALYFLSDRSGKYQLWKLPVDAYGEASQVTSFDRGIDALVLSPDESRLLLSFEGEIDAKPADEEPGKSEAQAKRNEPWVITRLHFKEDAGDGYLTGDRAAHLYVYDLKSKALRQITSGEYSEADPAWSPDGKWVVFASNRDADPDASYKSDLWIVAADNLDSGQSLVRLTQDDWVKSSPVWSPDGRSIAYITAEDGVYGIQHLAVIPATGGPVQLLTRGLERWVDDFSFAGNGEWIYLSYEQLGGSHLARVRPRDGRFEKVLEGERLVSAFDVAASGGVAARIESMNDAPEIYSVAAGRARRLTDINDEFLRSVTVGSKEKVAFESRDGTPIEAFVTKPPGFSAGRKYPTLLHIHGGPVGQFGYGYDFSNQYLASQGYVVVEPNPRGSTGRGQEFIRAIYRTWGITDYDDVIAAIDHVVEAGYADPDRLGVHGYSYGGYLTNVVITRTGRFKAAASGAGHSFIAANYGHDIYQKWYNWELGVPWENQEKYARLSPLLRAGEVSTPTMFFGGRNDWNVPVLNAELFYQSLKKRGIDTELVVYPDTHHGGWSEKFEKDRLVRMRQWFDRYLK